MNKILSNVPTIFCLLSGDKYEIKIFRSHAIQSLELFEQKIHHENNVSVAKNEAANCSKSEK